MAPTKRSETMRRFLSQLGWAFVATCLVGTALYATTVVSITDPASPMVWGGGTQTSCTATYDFTKNGQVTGLSGMRVRMICQHLVQRYSYTAAGTPANPFIHNFTCPTSDNWMGDPPNRFLQGESMTLWVEAINNLGGIDGSNKQGISVSP